MSVRALLRLLPRPPVRARHRQVRPSPAPRVRALEDRTLLSTFQVYNLHDSGPGSLRDAVRAANANPGADTVTFADGLAGTITLTGGDIVITDNLTVQGPGGITVSGGGTSRVFDVAGKASVGVSGLTLADGSAGQGGAILNETGSTLSLTNCTLRDNQAVAGAGAHAAGGAVFNGVGAGLVVNACLFQHNQALGGPNGAGVDGGAVSNFGDMTVRDTAFIGNIAQAGPNADGTVTTGSAGGGAIDNAGSPDGSHVGVLSIRNCLFANNAAVGGDNAGVGGFLNGAGLGGAIENLNASRLTVNDSSFLHNRAVAGSGAGSPALGGAIWNDHHATLSLANCTVRGNQALGGSGPSGQLGGAAFGGGIDNYNAATATVTDCAVAGNLAQGGAGSGSGDGGLAGGGGISSGDRAILFNAHDPCSLTVRNTRVAHNQAVGGNSGGTAGDLNSGADALGGGLFMADGPVDVSGCAFRGNTALGGAGVNGPGGDGYGGGIAVGYNGSTARLDLDHSAVSGNAATGGAASVGNPGGDGRGGGLYITGGAAVFLARNTSVLGNTASTDHPNIFGPFTRG